MLRNTTAGLRLAAKVTVIEIEDEGPVDAAEHATRFAGDDLALWHPGDVGPNSDDGKSLRDCGFPQYELRWSAPRRR